MPHNTEVVSGTHFLYAVLIRLIEKTSHNLYRHTLERLKTINPTLEELAELCNIFIAVLQNAGETKIVNMREAVTVIQEAEQAVSSGDEKTITDCAYHLEDFIGRFRADIK